MNGQLEYVYEVTYDVAGDRREEYENWVPGANERWLAIEELTHFSAYRNEKGLSPQVKLVFGFDSLRDWAGFVDSDAHKRNIDDLRSFCNGLQAVLWEPSPFAETFAQP